MSTESTHVFGSDRFIEISLSENKPDRVILRTAYIAANHVFINPKIGEFTRIGTRSLVSVEVDGDKDIHQDEQLTRRQTRERKVIKIAVAAIDSPHEEWLLDSIGHVKF